MLSLRHGKAVVMSPKDGPRVRRKTVRNMPCMCKKRDDEQERDAQGSNGEEQRESLTLQMPLQAARTEMV